MEVRFDHKNIHTYPHLPRRLTKKALIAKLPSNGDLGVRHAFLSPIEHKIIGSTPYVPEHPLTPAGLFCRIPLEEINTWRRSQASQEHFHYTFPLISRKTWGENRDTYNNPIFSLKFTDIADLFSLPRTKGSKITALNIRAFFELQEVNSKLLMAPPPIISRVILTSVQEVGSRSFIPIKGKEIIFPSTWVSFSDIQVPYLVEDLVRLDGSSPA